MMAVIGASLEGSRRAWQSFQGKCCDQLPSRFPDGVRFTGNSEGVIEHLPNYERVLKKFYRLLKPGGRVFLDGSAAKKKYELSTFMVRHIYPGNHSFLVLDDFLNKVGRTDFEAMEIHNDRWSYFLTFRQWARNLGANRDYVRSTFGDFEYRKFRLYLWGAAYEFLARNLDCYRLILYKPLDAR
jgi:cyclopropane-fatty-acyl-phospholipid synthase